MFKKPTGTMKKFLCVIWMICLVAPGFSSGKKDLIFQKDTIKKRMTTAALWQLQHPNHELDDWTNGAFYAGVMAAYETTRSKDLYGAMMKMGETNGWKPGKRLFHADDYAICQTYIDLYRKEKDRKMIQPPLIPLTR